LLNDLTSRPIDGAMAWLKSTADNILAGRTLKTKWLG